MEQTTQPIQLINAKIKDNLSQFRSVIKILSSLNTEIVLTFMENGVHTKVVHPSNICMLDILLKREFFDDYNVVKEITYTFDSKTFSMAMDRIGKGEITMQTTPEGLRLFNATDDYTLNYYVSKKDERDIPLINTSSKWKINPSNFFNTIGELVEFTALGIFTGLTNLELSLKCNMIKGATKLTGELIESDGCEGYYDMGYFIYISGLRNLFKEMVFEFGHQKTAFIHGENGESKFSFILASRVPDNG